MPFFDEHPIYHEIKKRGIEKWIIENDEYHSDPDFYTLSRLWVREVNRLKFTHALKWLGIPIIQTPTDIHTLQQLIWDCRPDIVIECGVAHGGNSVFCASMLALLDLAEKKDFGSRRVIGIDVEIRPQNREALEKHFLFPYLKLIEGSSTSLTVFEKIKEYINPEMRVMVLLDSNHARTHVLAELDLYGGLVSPGSYCWVYDTGIEYLSPELIGNRPWGKGNSPLFAVLDYVEKINAKTQLDYFGRAIRYVIDRRYEQIMGITSSPFGLLRRLPLNT